MRPELQFYIIAEECENCNNNLKFDNIFFCLRESKTASSRRYVPGGRRPPEDFPSRQQKRRRDTILSLHRHKLHTQPLNHFFPIDSCGEIGYNESGRKNLPCGRVVLLHGDVRCASTARPAFSSCVSCLYCNAFPHILQGFFAVFSHFVFDK